MSFGIRPQYQPRAAALASLVASGQFKALLAEHSRHDWRFSLDEMMEFIDALFGEAYPATSEVIDWHFDPSVKPDSDTTVMLLLSNASEPTWPGYWDDAANCWRNIDGFPVCSTVQVLAWADMPVGAQKP